MRAIGWLRPRLAFAGAGLALALLWLVGDRFGLEETVEIPLAATLVGGVLWYAWRSEQALRVVEELARDQAGLLAQQQRFLADLSHELRTPLTIARGHLELLRRDGSPEVAVALDELGRVERIVERLLRLARAEHREALALRQVRLDTFLEDVFLRWAEVAPRAWRLSAVVPGTLAADEDALRDALDALLENAVKHTEPGAVIELSAHAAGRDAIVEVADEGTGIPPAAVGRIFDRFARAGSGGSGLGLSIVQAVAHAHGGSCTVTSRPGRTVFTLRLPGLAVPG